MVTPADRNIPTKKVEKISKYKYFEIEITRMWGIKWKTIPIIIRAHGTIQKGTKKLVVTNPAPIIRL